jgi:hypothetical protein
MQQFRRGGFAPGTMAPGNVPVSPFAAHDPRGFGRGYSGAAQGDQIAPEQVRRAIARNGVVPFAEVQDEITAHNLPPQLVQSSNFVMLTAWGAAGAQLIIPKNPRRMSYLVSNFIGANLLMFSYDKPMDIGGNVGAGIPIGGYYQESNGSVNIDDIWVFCNDSTEDFTTHGGLWVLAYEGAISVAGNTR